MPRSPDKKPTPKKTTPVESVTHKDERTNIPTEELRGFFADDERSPKKLLYPRDPSLDPQLVWKGKDEQDANDLAVDVVPIYIQEKIHPQALIEDLRTHARGGGGAEPQLNMFADFNASASRTTSISTSTPRSGRTASSSATPFSSWRRSRRRRA